MFHHNQPPAVPNVAMRRTGSIWHICCALLLLSLHFATVPAQAQAEPGETDLPIRPTPQTLPERPKEKKPFKGGHIEMQINPGFDIWTEVEWQGGDGNWHVVEGWRGYASKSGLVRWYVAEKDFGNGPYRWQIYLYEEGDYLATTDLFMLPTIHSEKITVTTDIPELAIYFE